MTNWANAAAVVALLTVSASSLGQNVINADSSAAQAIIRRDDAGFVDCGVRVVVQVVLPHEAEIFDFSLNLTAQGSPLGLLKAGKYTVPGSIATGWNLAKRKPTQFPPSSYWFAEQSADRPLKPFKYAKGEDAGFMLGLAEFEPTAETIFSIVQGERVQFALRYPGDKMDRIISFKAEMDKTDVATFFDCLGGMQRRIKRSLEAEPETTE